MLFEYFQVTNRSLIGFHEVFTRLSLCQHVPHAISELINVMGYRKDIVVLNIYYKDLLIIRFQSTKISYAFIFMVQAVNSRSHLIILRLSLLKNA